MPGLLDRNMYGAALTANEAAAMRGQPMMQAPTGMLGSITPQQMMELIRQLYGPALTGNEMQMFQRMQGMSPLDRLRQHQAPPAQYAPTGHEMTGRRG